MILFDNWTISVIGLVARQYDNLSRRIDAEGDLPDGYTWQLLVQSGGNADTLLLQPTENGVGVVLTADNLSKSGEYYFQLRGVLKADGVTKRHTNVVSAYIPKSLTGVGTWPEVPTEFAQVEANILELYQHPPVPGSNGYWLVWDTDKDEYVESQLALPEATTGGTSDHSKLKNRDAADQHPMSAITGLQVALEGKQPVGDYLTEEQDPTVPEWAKQPQKPAYTAQEVGALPDTTPIPTALSELSEDATHRVVTDAEKAAWNAKSNFTGSYNDLTDKPVIPTVPVQSVNGKTGAVVLSAEDVGALPDSTVIPAPYTLPIASSTVLGGVQPVAKTDAMTQSVGVDEAGGLWTAPSVGISSAEWTLLGEYTMLVSDRALVIDLSQFEGITHFRIIGNFPKCSEACGTTYLYLGTDFNHTAHPKEYQNVYAFNLLAECELVNGQLYGFIGTLDGWTMRPAASVVINTPRDSGKNTSFKIYYANAVEDSTENTIQIWGY